MSRARHQRGTWDSSPGNLLIKEQAESGRHSNGPGSSRDGWTTCTRGGPGGLDWPRPDTLVCRCEEVPWAAIGAAVADGARDVRAVKGVTRCGMGYCQGRVCGPALQQAVAAATGRGLSAVGDLGSRPLISPVALGTIAASAPRPTA